MACDMIILRRNSISEPCRECVFVSAKTRSPLCIPYGVQRIASRQWSYAFFVRGSIGATHFLFYEEDDMAETIGTKEASVLWGYPQSTISRWCRAGLIKDASQDAPGSPWHIPKNAICPKPIRKKEG